MFSLYYNKPVFIDYGLAVLVQQAIGYKSLSGFVGTYLYSGQEMQQLYHIRGSSRRYIDLYYNDVQALTNTINYIYKNTNVLLIQRNINIQ